MTGYVSGDRKLIVRPDGGSCSVRVQDGETLAVLDVLGDEVEQESGLARALDADHVHVFHPLERGEPDGNGLPRMNVVAEQHFVELVNVRIAGEHDVSRIVERESASFNRSAPAPHPAVLFHQYGIFAQMISRAKTRGPGANDNHLVFLSRGALAVFVCADE